MCINMGGLGMKRTYVNKPVYISAIGFRKNLDSFPRRMEFDGNTYHFVDAGLRCLLRCGNYIAEFFTLSDGKSNYYLRIDNKNNTWMLLSISG